MAPINRYGRKQTAFNRLRSTLRLLYHGHSAGALRFQFAVLLVDLAAIGFFIATPLLRDNPAFLTWRRARWLRAMFGAGQGSPLFGWISLFF
jgi:hypothetical protein